MRTSIKRVAAVGAAALIGATALVAAPAAQAADGETSLATVLNVGSAKFDKNHRDFDIVTKAAEAVLAAKPDSAVALLADGTTALTAFIPTDRAFMNLASALTGKKVKTEAAAFKAVAGLGIDTVETVLLYHVVPGATITVNDAIAGEWCAAPDRGRGQGHPRRGGHGHRPRRLRAEAPEPARHPEPDRHQLGQHADRPRHQRRAAPDRGRLTQPHHVEAPCHSWQGASSVSAPRQPCAGAASPALAGWPRPSSSTRGRPDRSRSSGARHARVGLVDQGQIRRYRKSSVPQATYRGGRVAGSAVRMRCSTSSGVPSVAVSRRTRAPSGRRTPGPRPRSGG